MARVFTLEEIATFAENAAEELALAADDLIARASVYDLARYMAVMHAAHHAAHATMFDDYDPFDGDVYPLPEVRFLSALARYEVLFMEHRKRAEAEA